MCSLWAWLAELLVGLWLFESVTVSRRLPQGKRLWLSLRRMDWLTLKLGRLSLRDEPVCLSLPSQPAWRSKRIRELIFLRAKRELDLFIPINAFNVVAELVGCRGQEQKKRRRCASCDDSTTMSDIGIMAPASNDSHNR